MMPPGKLVAYVEHEGGSGAAVVDIFAIALIVLLLVLLFVVHPIHLFNTTIVSPTSGAGVGGGGTVHTTASSMPSVMASPSK
jgi:hypothetical protein